MVPGGGQPLVFGPATTGHLVADAVASDFALGSQPVDGEGVCEDFRETQANWGIQSFEDRKDKSQKNIWKTGKQLHTDFSNHLFSWCQQRVSSLFAHIHTPR